MKIVGLCTDEEVLNILDDQYKENTSESALHLLDGEDFKLFIEKAYPDDESIYKSSR